MSRETIIIQPIKVLMPNQSFVSEANCLSLQLSYNLTGGSFTITVMKDSVVLPPENFVITLPFGRFGVVKQVGHGFSTGGLVDTISGPAVPLAETQINFTGIPGGTNQFASILAGILAKQAVNWRAMDVRIKNFIFRGVALQGIQQLAGNVLGEVVIYKDNNIYVTAPGVAIGNPFVCPKSDVVSQNQQTDYSLDVKSVLNPALTAVNLFDDGVFIYDSAHAQKQPKNMIQCGAQSSKEFIPIPDGFLVDGTYEEWAPASATDASNPSPSVPNGRYWKVFPSPTSSGSMRGIINFTRLIKEFKIPGNVSNFIGSPVTGQTVPGPNTFKFQSGNSESGIFGFTADDTFVSDIITGQYQELKNAVVLTPPGGASGFADQNFYSIQVEFWTFPKVAPTVFPGAGVDPTNPFGLASDVVVVNPSSNVVVLAPDNIQTYWNYYLNQHRRINSPRLRTSLQCIYRNYLPHPGDSLIVPSLPVTNCGRISSVNLNFGRAGLTLNIQAELFNYVAGAGGSGFQGLN